LGKRPKIKSRRHKSTEKRDKSSKKRSKSNRERKSPRRSKRKQRSASSNRSTNDEKRRREQELEAKRKAERERRLKKAMHLDRILFSLPDVLTDIDPFIVNQSIRAAKDRESETVNKIINNVKQGMVVVSNVNQSIDPIVINMKVDQKKLEIKDELRNLHLKKNIMDSNEYNQKLDLFQKAIDKSPNKLEEAYKLEMSLGIQESRSVGKIKQVSFRSKSSEETATDIKQLIKRLQYEKKKRQHSKEVREQKQQIKIQKEVEIQQQVQSKQESELKARVLQRMHDLSEKRRIEREELIKQQRSVIIKRKPSSNMLIPSLEQK